jgi:ribonuclease VapC
MKSGVDVILDASAILALIQNEPGADKVAGALPRAAVSAVNFAEVITKLVQKTKAPERVLRTLDLLQLRVLGWDQDAARHSAAYAYLAAEGLSLGDRACITEAVRSNARILTADRRWKETDPISGRVDLIR